MQYLVYSIQYLASLPCLPKWVDLMTDRSRCCGNYTILGKIRSASLTTRSTGHQAGKILAKITHIAQITPCLPWYIHIMHLGGYAKVAPVQDARLPESVHSECINDWYQVDRLSYLSLNCNITSVLQYVPECWSQHLPRYLSQCMDGYVGWQYPWTPLRIIIPSLIGCVPCYSALKKFWGFAHLPF